MLAALVPASVARMRFPLAELTKPEVRALAASRPNCPWRRRADSQDLCFLAGTGKARFLARHAGLDDVPGEIVTASGEVVGRHDGFHHFTVGQRKGLGVRRPSRCTCCGPRRRRIAWSWARGTSSRSTGWRCAARGCTVLAPRSTPCGCATTPARFPAAWPAPRRRGPTACSSSSSTNPSSAPHRGSPPAFFAATSSSAGPRSRDDSRRNAPRTAGRRRRLARSRQGGRRQDRRRFRVPPGGPQQRGPAHPDDPQATYDYMVRAWADPDAEYASNGWPRIINQAGPELTWE